MLDKFLTININGGFVMEETDWCRGVDIDNVFVFIKGNLYFTALHPINDIYRFARSRTLIMTFLSHSFGLELKRHTSYANIVGQIEFV